MNEYYSHTNLAKTFFIFFFLPFFSPCASYTWNGVTSTAWATGTNWTPNGIPGAGDNITIVTAGNNPIYNGVAGVTNITMTSGILNLNGFSLVCTGTALFNGGTISNGTINPTGITATFAGTTFNAVVNANCGNINLNGCVFNTIANFTKTNSTSNNGNGGNTFNSTTVFNQSGTGLLRTGNVSTDIFNGDLYINVSTNGNVFLAENSSTQFNGNIVFTNTNNGDIYFCNGTGTATLASTKTLSLGVAGFSGGSLRFKNFTQSDASTPQSMTAFTGNATAVYFLTGNSFAGNVSVTAGSIFFHGSTFTGTTNFIKTGTSMDDCDGGNNYLGSSNSFSTQAGADRWRMANVNPDIFNNATFTHEGSSNFIVARQTLGNIFNGTTTFNSNTSGGVYINRANGSNDGSAIFNGPVIVSVQLSGNVTFSEGSGSISNSSTFNSSIQLNSSSNSTGDIIFGQANTNNACTLNNGAAFIGGSILGATQVTIRNCTQTGSTAQNITLNGTGILNFGTAGFGNTFNGACSFSAPTINFNSSILNNNCIAASTTQLILINSVFNGASNSFNKGGATLSSTSGGNTFGAASSNTFVNSGTGGFRFGGAADVFNGNALYIQSTGAGALEPAYSNFSTYAKDISTTGTTALINFGVGGGGANIAGTGLQNINGSSSFAPLFYNLITNHSGTLTLNVPIAVRNTLTMNSGLVNINTNILTLGISTAVKGTLTYTGGWFFGGTFSRWFSTASFAIGNDLGLFPMGSTNLDYRPVWIAYSVNLSSGGTISIDHNPTYNPATITAGHTDASWGNTVLAVSSSNWVVSTQNAFAFNGATGSIRYGGTGFSPFVLTDLDASLLASVVGTHGAATSINTALEVNRTALTTANFANTWRVGTRNLVQSPLPIELINFSASAVGGKVTLDWSTASEKNNLYFVVQKSTDGFEFDNVCLVNGAGTSSILHSYNAMDEKPYKGVSYYRLKQTDANGQFTYSPLVNISISNHDKLNIRYNAEGDASLLCDEEHTAIDIYDEAGGRLVSEILNEQPIPLTTRRFKQLQPGLYVIVARQGNFICRAKFVVK